MNQRELHSTITDLTLLTNTLRMRRDTLKVKVRGLEKRVRLLERERNALSEKLLKAQTHTITVTPIHLQDLQDGYLSDVTA